MESKNSEWFYLYNRETIGPIALSDFNELIKQGKINQESLVLESGQNWIKAKDSDLSELFDTLEAPDKKNPHFYFYVLCTIPIISIIIDYFMMPLSPTQAIGSIAFFVISHISLCILDSSHLRKNHLRSPNIVWCIIFLPIYIWLRGKINNISPRYFFGWLFILITSTSIMAYVESNVSLNGTLEPTACSIVTNIIRENITNGTECRAVEIISEVSKDFYKANAILENGHELKIIIEVKDDYVHVKIP